jgi:nucleotide-binding universal stress UspA family protein
MCEENQNCHQHHLRAKKNISYLRESRATFIGARHALERETVMNRILAAVDLSEGAETVLTFSAELAREEHAKLTVIYAHPATLPVNVLATTFGTGTFMVPEYVPNELETFRERLEQIVVKTGLTGVDCVCVQGPVVEAIRDTAEKLHSDIIITGQHHHGRLFHAVFGSIHEALMSEAPCPVVVVPNSTHA